METQATSTVHKRDHFHKTTVLKGTVSREK